MSKRNTERRKLSLVYRDSNWGTLVEKSDSFYVKPCVISNCHYSVQVFDCAVCKKTVIPVFTIPPKKFWSLIVNIYLDLFPFYFTVLCFAADSNCSNAPSKAGWRKTYIVILKNIYLTI